MTTKFRIPGTSHDNNKMKNKEIIALKKTKKYQQKNWRVQKLTVKMELRKETKGRETSRKILRKIKHWISPGETSIQGERGNQKQQSVSLKDGAGFWENRIRQTCV